MSSGKHCLAALLLLACPAALAAEGRGVGLRADLQVDDRSGNWLGAGLDLEVLPGSWVSLDAGRSDAGSDFGNLRSTLYALRWDHRFAGPLGVEAGWERWGDSGFFETATLHAGLSLSGEHLRFGIEGRWRDSTITLVVPNPPGAAITGDCDTDDFGFGASLSWTGARGGWYVRGRDWDYDRTLCRIGRFTLDIFNLPPQALIRVPALELLQASAVSRAHSLFDRSLALGGHLQFDRRRLRVEYARDVGAFDELRSDTVSLGLVFEFAGGLDLGFSVGVTDTERVGRTEFAGISLSWYR